MAACVDQSVNYVECSSGMEDDTSLLDDFGWSSCGDSLSPVSPATPAPSPCVSINVTVLECVEVSVDSGFFEDSCSN